MFFSVHVFLSECFGVLSSRVPSRWFPNRRPQWPVFSVCCRRLVFCICLSCCSSRTLYTTLQCLPHVNIILVEFSTHWRDALHCRMRPHSHNVLGAHSRTWSQLSGTCLYGSTVNVVGTVAHQCKDVIVRYPAFPNTVSLRSMCLDPVHPVSLET